MRIALLGIDDDTERLIEAITLSSDHDLVGASIRSGDCSRFRDRFPHIPCNEDWESLLSRTDIEAIVVARGRDAAVADEQLKKFAQTGLPLLVAHPGCDLMTAYEVEMLSREKSGVLVPFARHWSHPGWKRVLDECIAPSGKEGLERIIFERSLDHFDRDQVLRQLTLDILPLRQWLGEITNLNAAGATFGDSKYAGLSVHFAGRQGTARWSILPPGAGDAARVTITTRLGTSRLLIPRGDEPWNLLLLDASEIHITTEKNSEQESLARFERAIRGEPYHPAWPDICLDLEIVDCVQASLRRKRSIDLYLGERSEEKTFKAFMAAAGCLILAAILAVFVVLAVFEGIRIPFRETVSDIGPGETPSPAWPLALRLWPIYPLLAFLLLQLLLSVAKRNKPDRNR